MAFRPLVWIMQKESKCTERVTKPSLVSAKIKQKDQLASHGFQWQPQFFKQKLLMDRRLGV